MARGVAFAVLCLPAVLWSAAHLWAEPRVEAWSAGWAPGAPDLGACVRLVYSFDVWMIRMLPFLMIPVLLAQPLIVWAIARLAGARSSAAVAESREVLHWWFVSFVLSIEWLTITLVWGDRVPIQVVFFAMWVVLVAFWIALAAAYGVQQRRRLANRGAWHPRWLLGMSWLGGFGWFILPVMVLVMMRRESGARPA